MSDPANKTQGSRGEAVTGQRPRLCWPETVLGLILLTGALAVLIFLPGLGSLLALIIALWVLLLAIRPVFFWRCTSSNQETCVMQRLD